MANSLTANSMDSHAGHNSNTDKPELVNSIREFLVYTVESWDGFDSLVESRELLHSFR